jgi:UDP-2,3-diacylglucosamine pyrophosphatase LpxH
VATVLVSDFHLGTRLRSAVAMRSEPRRRLLEAVAGADQVILLGDVLDLRERPVAEVLALTASFFEELGEAAAGARIVIVPGNHDYQLAAPLIERRRLKGTVERTELEAIAKPGREGLAAALTRRLRGADVAVAYPGLWVRPDVYATHGHYLDCHLTVPRAECLIAAVMQRVMGLARDQAKRPGTGAGDYEAVLAPLYAFLYNLSQSTAGRRSDESVALKVWEAVNGKYGRRSMSGRLLGGVVLPGAVAALNRVGLGPFKADISGIELRRAGLRAMGEVVSRLGVEADHVIFGHTHRAGPFPGESEGWTLSGGTRLTNTGSWIYERAFLEEPGSSSPYWPGTCVVVGDSGPPELRPLLGDLAPEDVDPDPRAADA